MKKIILLPIALFGILFLFSSCKKEDDTNASPLEEETFINAKINGVDYSSTEVLVSAFPEDTEFYTINSYDDNNDKITLTIEGQPELGTFSPSLGNDFTTLYYSQYEPNETWFAADGMGEGTITVTENSATSISGTFSFVGETILDSTSTISITEGSFRAKKL